MSADESDRLDLDHPKDEAQQRLHTIEAAHAESEASFRLLVESVSDYAADEIIGQHFSRFFPEEDL